MKMQLKNRNVPYKRNFLIFILSFFIILTLALLFLNKKIRPNLLIASRYDVTGIDVSHYQGTIDWKKMEQLDIDFAYIKATEGSSFVDENFSDNWENATDTNIFIGAYHFFSFESDGKTQAEHYIATVGDLEGKLVPVVDVEYYGDKKKQVLDKNKIRQELSNLLYTLECKYDRKPVIYTTYPAYHDFIKDAFEEYDLWIRNVYYSPSMDMKGKWIYWQYTDRAKLPGYNGREKYIDMNVYTGSMEEFLAYNSLK